MAEQITTYKGFIKDWQGNHMLPITRAELVLDSEGDVALHSNQFLAVLPINDNSEGKPGLISGKERQAIQQLLGSNNADGSAIGAINQKLNWINSSLYVNNDQISYYNTTLNTIKFVNSDTITVTATSTDNTTQISFNLPKYTVTGNNNDGVVKSITYDNTGRILTVAKDLVDSSEIVGTLSNKTLTGCTTTTTPSKDSHIVNKSYVDSQIESIQARALGALTFGGPISNENTLRSLHNASNKNTYYKITGDFFITETNKNLFESTIDSLKAGDSVILWETASNNLVYTHIPSGDEDIVINVSNNNTNVGTASGYVSFAFNGPLTAANNVNEFTISIPNVASSNVGGYLSRADYERFNAVAATSKGILYTPTLEKGDEIGKLTIGDSNSPDNTKSLYAPLYKLSLEKNDVILTKNDTEVNTIKFEGSGINIESTDGILTFSPNIATQTYKDPLSNSDDVRVNYFTIQDGFIEAVIGKEKEGGGYTPGLTNYADFRALELGVSAYISNSVEIIPYSLEGLPTSDEPYKYGSGGLSAIVGNKAITI